MKLDIEKSKIILAEWLQGEHLEDTKLFKASEFECYQSVAAEIINNGNVDVADMLGKKIATAKDFSDIVTSYLPGIYGNVVMSVAKDRAFDELMVSGKGKTPDELANIIAKYQIEWHRGQNKPANIIEEFTTSMKRLEQGKLLKTGFRELDKKTYGIHPGELVAVGARPGTGKSAFCLQLALNVSKQGGKVLFFPLEMNATQTMERLIMRSTSKAISQENLRTGRLTANDWELIKNETFEKIRKRLDDGTFQVYVGTNHIEDIVGIVSKENPDLVIIDQLSQLRSRKVEFYSVRERFAYMTSNLKALTLSEDITVYLACQLNREVKLTGKAQMENLKEAGNIEEDSDAVLLMTTETDSDGEIVRSFDGECRVVNFNLTKQRQGAPGTFNMYLWEKRFTFKDFDDPKNNGFEELKTNDIPF